MRIQQLIEDFQEAMEHQLEMMEALIGYEQQLQRAVVRKDWTELQDIIERLYELGDGIYHCEQRRFNYYTDICRQLGLPESTHFPVAAGYLDPESRRSLSSLYRRLQITVKQVQSLSQGIESYITNSIRAMNEVVEEIFPASRGSLYSYDGNVRGKQPPAMVINHRT